MRPLQNKRKKQLEASDFLVYCLDDIERIGGILVKYKPHEYQSYATEFILSHPYRLYFLKWV